MVAIHNPFRTPTVTPTPTGRTGRSSPPLPSPPVNDDVPPPSSYAPPPGPPPERVAPTSTPPERTGGSVAELLKEELPPAYTATPNVREGETTLELGPRRPFQQPVATPSRHQAQFPPPTWGMTSPQLTGGSSWSSFPGNVHRSGFAPPPQHPVQRSQTTRLRPLSSPDVASNAVSDFARDFYAAGPDDGGLFGGSSSQYQSRSAGASPTSPSASSPANPGFAPALHSSSSSNDVADDGRPTDRPVPGHPLLRHGKVLVYPNGFECQKCRNTGYKNYDPSHPCSRCWEKYAKPYAGAIVYAPWTPGPDGPSASSSSTYQRPLPVFRSPQSSLHNHSASWAGPSSAAQELSRSATTSRVPSGAGYPGASSRVVPIAGGVLPMSSYLDRLGVGAGARTGFPPPSWGPVGELSGGSPSLGNVVVYSPGDPRIGGRLCWRCGGSGKTSFLIFDEDTCGICNGVGRTFV
ncbi:hypothetical protein BD311DRAFT_766962 [Dichomitus squalens]|uniref:Uncharacterized protein n=1 Tax=Dichomitus squalens TaxID=114155 RepID=A0A4Q9MDS2_9APHY|nr:hypothetical protein BD311DRAFT_766962 [Dichomitus squalens]